MLLFDIELKPFIEWVFQKVKEDYPKAFKRLLSIYGHKPKHKFLIVRRFLKCNFIEHDSVADIDINGDFNLECVHCPLKGECNDEDIICNPEFNTNLSDREMEITVLYAKGITKFDISEKLFISEHTVKNHIRNVFKKLGINSIVQLTNYMNDNNLI